jgi:carbon starvation protein
MIAVILILSLLLFALAYATYSKFLAKKVYDLNCEAKTPAELINDGIDYIPTNKWYLLAQHFSAISAAGPIFGPIIAGLAFGWLPAILWIVIGAIFIGSVHDFSTLVGSVKHKACSVAEIVKEHTGKKAYYIFIGYIWIAIIYILTAFTDVTASAFTNNVEIKNNDGVLIDTIIGGGTASSSIIYLSLAVLLGLALKVIDNKIKSAGKIKWTRKIVVTLSLLLVGFSIWYGQENPISVSSLSQIFGEGFIQSFNQPKFTWAILILIYCGVASVLPMWLLLQPRGLLGGSFLYIILFAGVAGIISGSANGDFNLTFTSFITFNDPKLGPLVPILFTTIACGACSGFHGIVCSGTTSKQLKSECDAPLVGYGAMLLEGVIALVALSTVMILLPKGFTGTPDAVFATGMGRFIAQFGIDLNFAISLAMLAFATFVFDTIDVTTRLGRYLVQELLGIKGRSGSIIGTAATLIIPMILLTIEVTDASGKIIPAYLVVWSVFGASNQLLAALSLTGLFVWLRKLNKGFIQQVIVGVPMVFMTVITLWTLLLNVDRWFVAISEGKRTITDPSGILNLLLIALALSLLYYSGKEIFKKKKEVKAEQGI